MVPDDVIPESVEQEPNTPLELSSFLDVNTLPPIYLEYFERLKLVEKSKGSEALVVDNGYNHTLRLLEVVKNSPVSLSVKEVGTRVLFIHELPKAAIGNKISEGYVAQEFEAAKALFDRNPRDLELFQYFKTAEDYLCGRSDKYVGSNFISRAVVFAKLQDNIEENMYHNRSVAAWVKAGSHLDYPLGPMNWLFSQFESYVERIQKLNIPDLDKMGLIDLLKRQVIDIRDMWNGLELPEPMTAGFARIGKYFED